MRPDKPTIVKHPDTDVDVRLLLTTFPDLLPDGRVISHVEVEAALHSKRSTSYYRTVTKHWRRALFNEQKLYLDGRLAYGEGFKVLTPQEMIRFGDRRVRGVGRAMRKAVAVIAAPSDEAISDPNLCSYRARVLALTEQILSTHGKMIREVGAALRSPAQLPRPSLAP